MVISACYGNVLAITEILKLEGYLTSAIITGKEEMDAEDFADNIFSLNTLKDVIERIDIICPDIIFISQSLNQVCEGEKIVKEAGFYRYVTLSFGQLVQFPCYQTCIFEPADYSYISKQIWLKQLKQFIGD